MDVVEFFIQEHGRHPMNDPIGRKYKHTNEEMMEFAEKYAEYKQNLQRNKNKRIKERKQS